MAKCLGVGELITTILVVDGAAMTKLTIAEEDTLTLLLEKHREKVEKERVDLVDRLMRKFPQLTCTKAMLHAQELMFQKYSNALENIGEDESSTSLDFPIPAEIEEP
jgi:uncharacterized Fe-S cluster-containing protein